MKKLLPFIILPFFFVSGSLKAKNLYEVYFEDLSANSTGKKAIDFSAIDAMVNDAINYEYFPGAQLLIANKTDGILYQRSYGYYTYDRDKAVTENSIFDLASLTKVIATTSAIMKLYDEGKIELNDKVTEYVPEFGQNGKEYITIRNLLLHNSGLKAWMPFYKTCISKEDVRDEICRAELSYHTGADFKYSDLNAIMLGIIVEEVTNTTLDQYCHENIFYPLGMTSTYFNPDDEYQARILPTEYDGNWRMRQIAGEVHDEAACVMGGVSGNAGLFSNTGDIYKLVSMLLNGGLYRTPEGKEERFISQTVVDLFLACPKDLGYYNTRALGWDTKPEPTSYRIPCGELISENCFGHTGYTGTSVWCDRDRDLIIIFLTNRVYPSRSHNGIRDFRPELHNAIIELYSN